MYCCLLKIASLLHKTGFVGIVVTNFSDKEYQNDNYSHTYIHWPNKVLAPPGDQFLDFHLRSFIDPKPVELGESYITLKFAPSLLV